MNDFADQHGLASLTIDKRFERFSTYCVVSARGAEESFNPEDITVEGAAFGIDGLAVVKRSREIKDEIYKRARHFKRGNPTAARRRKYRPARWHLLMACRHLALDGAALAPPNSAKIAKQMDSINKILGDDEGTQAVRASRACVTWRSRTVWSATFSEMRDRRNAFV
ncbi:MAG TPA: hypothetical protein VFS37_13890 [Conexibacter sp.]|nr:hypothetical protein [Conexibacter sp.]